MSEKRLCVIDSCDYCPFFEKLEIKEQTKNNFVIDADFYKCNRTKLCVQVGKSTVKHPMKILFSFCTLPSVSGDVDYVEKSQKSKKHGWDSEPNTDYVTRVAKEMLNDE